MRIRFTVAYVVRCVALGAVAFTAQILSPVTLSAAQSGRRTARPAAARQPPPPTAADVKLPSAAPAESATQVAKVGAPPAVKFRLVVAGRIETKNSSERATTIFNKFIERLADSPAVTVNSLGLVKREEAVKRAQTEADTYLVWLQLETDAVQDGRFILNSPDIEVRYQVYAPGVAKVKTKGKVYYQAMGGPKVRQDRWPSGTPIKITPEAAGAEAAEMVLDWFKLAEAQPPPGRKN